MTQFSATLRSEWTKLSSLRSTKVMLACSLLLALALTALLAIVVAKTVDNWEPADRRAYEPIGAALFGGIASAIFFLVLGVKAATGEYGAGMMRLTLTATPRRGRVLAAKALVVTAITIAAALVCKSACSSWRRRSSAAPPSKPRASRMRTRCARCSARACWRHCSR